MKNQNHLHHLNFHHHHHHQEEEKELKDVPNGCLAIMVEQQRFVIPVIYVNHPLFEQLLKEAEEEYGFDKKGPITIPSHVEEFQAVKGMIHKGKSHHHRLLLHGLCFSV